MISSSVEYIQAKGSEEVPYSSERSTHTIGDCGSGNAAQARKIDCYASSIGLSSITSAKLSYSIIEDNILFFSTLATSNVPDGGGSVKVRIKEGSLKRLHQQIEVKSGVY